MINNATINDINFIFKISSEFTNYFKNETDVENIIKSEYNDIFVYKDEENNVLGFVHILNSIDTIDLINLGVDINHRNKKIGGELLKYIVKYSAEKKIFLEVACDNIKAINLYNKNNFKVIQKRENYYRNGKSCLVMMREFGE